MKKLFLLPVVMFAFMMNTIAQVSNVAIWDGSADAQWTDGIISYYGMNMPGGAQIFKRINATGETTYLFTVEDSPGVDSEFGDDNAFGILPYNNSLYVWAAVNYDESALMRYDLTTNTTDYSKRFAIKYGNFRFVTIIDDQLYVGHSGYKSTGTKFAIGGNWTNSITLPTGSDGVDSVVFKLNLDDFSVNPTVWKFFKKTSHDYNFALSAPMSKAGDNLLFHFVVTEPIVDVDYIIRHSLYQMTDMNGNLIAEKQFDGPAYLAYNNGIFGVAMGGYTKGWLDFVDNYLALYDANFNLIKKTPRVSREELNGMYSVDGGYIATVGYQNQHLHYSDYLKKTYMYLHVDTDLNPLYSNANIPEERTNSLIKNSGIFTMTKMGYIGMFHYTSQYASGSLGGVSLPANFGDGKIVQYYRTFEEPNVQMNFTLGPKGYTFEQGKKLSNGVVSDGDAYKAVLTVKNTELSTLVGSKIPAEYVTYTAPGGWAYVDNDAANYGNYGIGTIHYENGEYYFTLAFGNGTNLAFSLQNSVDYNIVGYIKVYLKNEIVAIDTDGDTIPDSTDNCPNTANTNQLDTDNDGIGDVCDDDDDNDGVLDINDSCPNVAGTANGCPDADGDGVRDSEDLCPDLSGTANGCPDADTDGVRDSLDLYPGTPTGSTVDSNGGVVVPFDNFMITQTGATCVGKNNATWSVVNKSSYLFDIYVNGNVIMTNVLANTALTVGTNLAPGTYSITFKFSAGYGADITGYVVTLEEAKALSAKKIATDSKAKTATFSVENTLFVDVSINDITETYTFSDDGEHIITLDLANTVNKIKIDAGCKGSIEDIIYTSDIKIYPNPTAGRATISGLFSEQVIINIHSLNGSLVSQKNLSVHNNSVDLSLDNLPVGLYLINVIGEQDSINLKIVKK